MKERPIIFSAPMVRALLDGSKTQTRRVVKVKPIEVSGFASYSPEAIASVVRNFCPYGVPGDRLWVREMHILANRYKNVWCTYPADGEHCVVPAPAFNDIYKPGKVRPSIHMPRWASRISLEIMDIRVERLHAIRERDAQAEGAKECDYVTGREVLLAHPSQHGSFIQHYREIWETINGPGSWDANPWVWVIEFKRVT